MTCDSFLEAFFRFFNSLGHATRFIWCDNGTNLKSGSKTLTSSFGGVKWKGVVDKWSAHGVAWRHIPPYAPSKGGNWDLGTYGRVSKKSYNRYSSYEIFS